MKSFKQFALTLAFGLVTSQAHAVAVDAELSLVIDVSGSVDGAEYNLMMDGYANAFRDTSVQSNILDTSNGATGSIAVNVVFFSSGFFTTSLDSFQLLDSATDIDTFANTLDSFARPGSGLTDIFDGMNRSTALFASNGFESTNLIMDVSGDGVSNIPSTQAARDAAAAAGITVNGISIGNTSIETFYNDNVKTSDGFVIHANSFAEFETGIVRKLRVETGGSNDVPEPATLALLGLGVLGFTARRKA